MALNKKLSVSELTEFLVEQYSRPYVRAFIDETAKGGRGWQEAYEDIVLDQKIKSYISTAWIRTKEYIVNVGRPLWMIDRRSREDESFNVEKMFIISPNSWYEKDIWEWIGYWLIYCIREERFRIFIVKEKDAYQATNNVTKYYDMGIYKEASDREEAEVVVGYLTIDEKSNPGPYQRFSSRDTPEEKSNAEHYYKELKKCAQTMKTIEDFTRIRAQDYDEVRARK